MCFYIILSRRDKMNKQKCLLSNDSRFIIDVLEARWKENAASFAGMIRHTGRGVAVCIKDSMKCSSMEILWGEKNLLCKTS